ncbi:DNA-3-methyladenine glycosylase I [Gemelliphila palaticanis]|uniref:DNA-3-methyladenine glycosylase I n=1 Tax=Gemelliphila palaticanis TaxID=81950 RepID=A0ABX2T1B7_9BACL|nr:DNA-3-methyladenine glycosylase I [Gemella palaticanis]MBF0715314.1 DNA-3-methyladenine glycosylase I [Gemella palaticanis]NYS47244.1 DNA-3-methyladenine glycosylase I [Gemella palaticanis]
MKDIKRCDWVSNELLEKYHDNIWGKIEKSNIKLFEMLILECMQAGLSWNIVLKKKENLQKVFSKFNYMECAQYTDEYLNSLLNDSGIIRHRLKIFAVRQNAISFIKIIDEFGSFYNYIWGFVDYKQIVNNNKKYSDIKSKNFLSDIISKDMKKRGFKFVGSTTIYSYLQAIGVINDHLVDCICYSQCID